MASCVLHNRQKFRLARAGGQSGATCGCFATRSHRRILISIIFSLISGLAFTVNLQWTGLIESGKHLDGPQLETVKELLELDEALGTGAFLLRTRQLLDRLARSRRKRKRKPSSSTLK